MPSRTSSEGSKGSKISGVAPTVVPTTGVPIPTPNGSQSESLVGDRRQDEQIRGLVPLDKLGVGHDSQKAHIAGHSEVIAQRFEGGPQLTVANDHQLGAPRLTPDAGKCGKQRLQAHARDKTPHGEHDLVGIA